MTKVGHGPMLAKLEPEIPRGPGWTYEPKWDGFRTIVTVGDEIRLDSRTDRPMVRFFPELVVAARGATDGPFVADGEIVMVRPGRLAFDELQLRLHPAESRVRKLAAEIPASLILFDLLEEDGEKLGPKPLAERRDRLAKLSKRLHVPQAAERPGRSRSRPGPPAHAVDRRSGRRGAMVRRRGRPRSGRHRGQAGRPALPPRRPWLGEGETPEDRRLRGGRVPRRQGWRGGRLAAPRSLRRRGRAALRRTHVVVRSRRSAGRSRSCSDRSRRARRVSEAVANPADRVGGLRARTPHG